MSCGHQMHKLGGLQPVFAKKVRQVVCNMEKRGWRIRIVWGKRTKQENDKLVRAGLASKHSKHLIGKACDLAERTLGNAMVNHNHKFYKDLEELAKKEGLIWGGNFKGRWDPCHIEIR